VSVVHRADGLRHVREVSTSGFLTSVRWRTYQTVLGKENKSMQEMMRVGWSSRNDFP
jgi:hypothetical protein